MKRFSVRASSWGALFDCSHRWEGVHLLGMFKPSGLRAQLGTAIHASTAIFDTSRMNDAGLTADECAQALVDTLRRPDRECDFSGEDLTVNEAERIGLALHAKYCEQISPRYTFFAVELTTKTLVIDCGNGVEIEMTGTMDRARVVECGGELAIGDLKSGKNAVSSEGLAKTRGHAPQVGTYQILTEHTTGIRVADDAEIIGLSTGNARVAVSQIENPRSVLLGSDGKPGLLTYAAEMFKSGLFPPNNQSMLCGAKYCARFSTCQFHG